MSPIKDKFTENRPLLNFTKISFMRVAVKFNETTILRRKFPVQLLQPNCVLLFSCLFDDAVNNSDYIVSNDWIVAKYEEYTMKWS
jgi:hypothetical protein